MSAEHHLDTIAKQVMIEKGLEPVFSKEVLREIAEIKAPSLKSASAEDLRLLPWCSIDNENSRDLDQLTYAEKNREGKTILCVAIADVASLVQKDSAIDEHARLNTTSVYTPSKVFPMLPEKLSTDLTSLNENEDRLAYVVKMTLNRKGLIEEGAIFPALVHNHAKLTYPDVGAWLEGSQQIPEKIVRVAGMEISLQIQHHAAQLLRKKRHESGALTLETPECDVKLEGQEVCLNVPIHNYAHELIEDLMIAANTVIAKHFNAHKIVSLRRVVRIPKKWERIVELARQSGETLPEQPNSKALEQFLLKRKKADPESFPDLSLAVVKLLGRGEYIVEVPGDSNIGHFGLSISQYTHSTAPNRRYPDLISQRQYKAYAYEEKEPYTLKELQWLADHCTRQEDAALKVERHLNKSAAAQFLSSKIGETFNGIITGASSKGTWVKIFKYHIEGKVIQGEEGLDVGDKVMVKLVEVDIPNGYIDFIVVSSA